MDIIINLLLFLHVLFLYVLSFKTCFSFETSTIFPGQFISGNQTITSQGGRFELGFFKPKNSQNYYIGIWYRRVPSHTIVWVANRDKPLLDPFSSKLEFSNNGNLVLYNQSRTQMWSTGLSSNTINSTIALLEDTGNLVLRDSENSSLIVWQSFDHPTDTWLPGGKLGLNKLTKERQIYFSWSKSDDPAPGPFSLELDQYGTKHFFIMKNGNRQWTCGIWPGRVVVFGTDTPVNKYNEMSYVSNEKENYFTYSVTNSSILTRFVMELSGHLRQYTWLEDSQKWELIWSQPKHQCETYALCGEYGVCNQFSMPTCRCLQGFEPRYPTEWNSGNHSNGCVRRTPLQCSKGGKDGFLVIPNIRLPSNSLSLTVKSTEECESACLKNCSCTAYTYDGECLIWQKDLLNIRYLSFGDNGREIHLRLAMLELISLSGKTKGKVKRVIVVAVAGVTTLVVILGFIVWRCRKSKFSGAVKATEDSLILFKYNDLKNATKNFSERLGAGGFGCVFKGTLPNSATIAVKTLKCHCQVEKQFRTEVSTMGTIHHINLVRLRGFCIEGMKRFLVYDFMPNSSLESHLFHKDSKILDWKTRYHIALGIAKGLAYLHEKCRDCIIHCDIKPENILLDAGYNPKVADFGLAKLLGRDFSRVLTTIKGTRGYLAPEWISGVAITAKADVFSYGMLLFEIISGKRNWDISDDGTNDYFPVRAMVQLREGGDVLSLLDYRLEGNTNKEELTRACMVACWCIQDNEKDRPSMGHVVQILEGVLEVTLPPIPRFLQRIAEYKEDEVSM